VRERGTERQREREREREIYIITYVYVCNNAQILHGDAAKSIQI